MLRDIFCCFFLLSSKHSHRPTDRPNERPTDQPTNKMWMALHKYQQYRHNFVEFVRTYIQMAAIAVCCSMWLQGRCCLCMFDILLIFNCVIHSSQSYKNRHIFRHYEHRALCLHCNMQIDFHVCMRALVRARSLARSLAFTLAHASDCTSIQCRYVPIHSLTTHICALCMLKLRSRLVM